MSSEDSHDDQCCLNQRTINRLERHRTDYAAVTGKPFEHFFCPILFADDRVELMRGHVINEAFKGSSKAWVIQRKDVDGFFGGFFEGDFELLQFMIGATQLDYFTNPKLFSAVRPKIFYGAQEVQYFLRLGKDRNKPPPAGFQLVEFEVAGQIVEMNVKATSEQMIANPGLWSIETKKDLQVPALVSLIKAAHLSMFSVLGYHYVLSNAGRFIGQDILGGFYRSNHHLKTKREAQSAALPFFRRYRHMVRLMQPGSNGMEGTLTDGHIRLCMGTSGSYWAMMILVRTAKERHAVLLPYPESADSLATFLEFLRNDHEQIHVVQGKYEADNGRWVIDQDRRPVCWPKGIDTYPRSIE